MKRISPHLPYAPAPHWTRRPRLGRGLFLGAAALVAISAFVWGPPVVRRVRLVHWQARCMNYPAPAMPVFMAGDTKSVAAAIAGQSDYQPMRLEDESVAFCVPRVWQTYSELANGIGRASQGTLFLGARRSPSGRERLVAVDAYISSELPRRVFAVTRVIVPASLLSAPREAAREPSPFFIANLRGVLRIHAGKTDPANAAHFTIEYTADSPHITYSVDGWLRDDDTILLERQTPRAIIPPAPSLPAPSR